MGDPGDIGVLCGSLWVSCRHPFTVTNTFLDPALSLCSQSHMPCQVPRLILPSDKGTVRLEPRKQAFTCAGWKQRKICHFKCNSALDLDFTKSGKKGNNLAGYFWLLLFPFSYLSCAKSDIGLPSFFQAIRLKSPSHITDNLERVDPEIEILHNKEICHLQLKKRRFIRLSSKFDYKSGQWSADFITVVRVHKPSSCPTDYTFCFSYRFLPRETCIVYEWMSLWDTISQVHNSQFLYRLTWTMIALFLFSWVWPYHVIWAFTRMPERHVLGHNAVQHHLHVIPHVGVPVLVDGQTGGRV